MLFLTACTSSNSSFLDPHGPVAATQRDLFYYVISWMAIVVVPVFLLTPLFAWRYRRRNGSATYRPEWELSKPLEVLIWGIPVVIVAVLSYFMWTMKLDPYAPVTSYGATEIADDTEPLVVQVVGLDWKWLFIYPEQGIATVGLLGLPVDRPIRFELTTDASMMSFWIPALGSQIYAMAGMRTELNLLANKQGDLYGANTQYNGDGFSRHRFLTSVLSEADFDTFIDNVRNEGEPLDQAAYDTLSELSITKTASAALPIEQEAATRIYFSSVPADLFASILDKYRRPTQSECDDGTELECIIEGEGLSDETAGGQNP